jgi:hypothetical protein
MPKLSISNNGRFNNVLIENELKYDSGVMKDLFEEHVSNLNPEQLAAYEEIIGVVDNGIESMFFLWLW